MLQFQRIQDTPVLAKGSTYAGWTADALAAPSVCWDGARFVMTVSMWSVANSQWATAFFTSSDLKAWSYVTNSLWVPSGGDYLIGNAGLAWFGGLYYFAYNHYGSTIKVALATSSDLVTWNVVGDPIIPLSGADSSGQADPSLTVNPNTGNLELWYVGQNARQIMFADSVDGTTWTKYGVYLNSSLWNVTNFGEPNAYFDGAGRYLNFDGNTPAEGDEGRTICQTYSVASDTSWTTYGTVLGPNPFNAWEGVQVFDACCIGRFDLGDGRGNKLWMAYAGGDTSAPTDNTNSSIGLAFKA